jgi:hypothetical protein
MSVTKTAPRWLQWVSILLLLWALAGAGAFYAQYNATPEDIAKLSPGEQEMWGHMPDWAWVSYAVAVFAGLGGAIGFLLKKRWGIWLFPISLIAVLVQFSYPFLIANGLATLGTGALIFPIFIIVMAALQSWLARHWTAKGWLS